MFLSFVKSAGSKNRYVVSYVIDGTLYERHYSNRYHADKFASDVGGKVEVR